MTQRQEIVPDGEVRIYWVPTIPEKHAAVRIPWRARLRWRISGWRERVGRKVGGWIAGVDLSERDDW